MRKLLDYRCTKTNQVFERFTEDTPTLRCGCGSEAKRLISPVTCQFKGRGFPGNEMRFEKIHERAGRGDNA